MRSNVTRRSLLKGSVIAAAAVGWGLPHHSLYGGPSSTPTDKSRNRPNIVMFISDDHGADFVGCYGNKDVQTPNIDAMAKGGARFTNVFAASPRDSSA